MRAGRATARQGTGVTLASVAKEANTRSDARRNRDVILDAAAETLARDPGASLLDIAATSGLARATVYRHFSNLEEVQKALIDEVEDLGRKVLQQGLVDALQGDAATASITSQMLRIVTAALPVETRYSRAIAKARTPEEGLLTTFGPVMRATVIEGQRRSEFARHLDPGATADALILLMIHAGRRVHRDGDSVDAALGPVRTFLRGMEVSPASPPPID